MLPKTIDIVIIGGGVIGCLVAYYLAKQKVKVLVLDRSRFGSNASGATVGVISPLWHENASVYMKNLLDDNFEFIICSVTTNGLDDRWLGKKITYTDLEILEKLSKKFQFNLNFEGGEAETFVLNCPLFNNPLKIIEFKKKWDGYRGRFEIVDIGLVNNVR